MDTIISIAGETKTNKKTQLKYNRLMMYLTKIDQNPEQLQIEDHGERAF